MSFSDAPISFPGLFGDWQFTVPSKALNIGNGIYWYGIITVSYTHLTLPTICSV